MNDLHIRTECRICGCPELAPFVNLGKTPLANKFISSPDVPEQYFPLDVKVCTQCYLVQLVDEVDNTLLFSDDYAFYSGVSLSMLTYYDAYAKDVLSRFPDEAKGFVVEIASNDGMLLKRFQDKGCQVLGVDPAKNLAQEAMKNGVPTEVVLFTKDTARDIVSKYRQASLILANHVVAHIADLHDFMRGIDLLLSENGVFIFEVQYFLKLLLNNQFDNIYHEHRSFFSFKPLVTLCEQYDLRIFDVQQNDRQGGSLRIFVCREKTGRKVSSRVQELLDQEHRFRLDDIKTYEPFQHRVELIRDDMQVLLGKLKREGKRIAGYGASAKGSTFLNYCDITTDAVEYITDKTPYKIGKYTPGTHIPVFDRDEKIKKDGYPDYFLLLIWNYAEDVFRQEAEFEKEGGKFIVGIPYVRVV